jgi:signal transduction histidine kinase
LSINLEDLPEFAGQLREALHDMRQPVANTMALAAAALTEPDLPGEARGRLLQIVDQGQWLADMISACLALSANQTPDYVENEIDSSPICCTDITRIAGEVIAAQRLVWPGEITLTTSPVPLRCRLDPALLRRVVTNLVDNATHAASPAGTVTVDIRQDQDAVMLAVEDDGPGFGNVPIGTGLGLSAVARNIVKHGGKVECSRAASGGARVRLQLPLIHFFQSRLGEANATRIV